MGKDIDDLVEQLSLQQLKKLVSKYARIDKQLRDEILSTAPVRNASYNGLMLEEWKRRLEEALDRDLKGDVDDYYNQKFVSWDSTIEVLKKAIKELQVRNQSDDAVALLDETEIRIAKESQCEFVEDEYGTEIYVEYEDVSKEFDKLRYLVKSESEDTNQEYFYSCQNAAKKGDLKEVWLNNYTTTEDKNVQLQTVLEYLRSRNTSEQVSDWTYLKTAFDLLEELGKKKELIEFFKENSSDKFLRERMVLWYLKEKDYQSAEDILQEDVKLRPTSYDTSDRLIEILRDSGKRDLLSQELIRRVKWDPFPKFTFFEELKELMMPEDWKSLISTVINSREKDALVRIRLCVETSNKTDLKAILSEEARNYEVGFCNKYQFNDISSKFEMAQELLRKIEPNFIPELGKKMVRSVLRRTRTRDEYRELAGIFNSFLNEKQAKEFSEELISAYRSRPAMRDEFRKLY